MHLIKFHWRNKIRLLIFCPEYSLNLSSLYRSMYHLGKLTTTKNIYNSHGEFKHLFPFMVFFVFLFFFLMGNFYSSNKSKVRMIDSHWNESPLKLTNPLREEDRFSEVPQSAWQGVYSAEDKRFMWEMVKKRRI